MTEGIGSAPTMSSGPSVSSTPSIGGGPKGFEGSKSSSGFSSRGLADFKPGMESSSKPMIDINRGNENKSMFKSPASFGEKKSMFDIAKPVTDHPIVPHANTPKPESRGNSIIDLNRGRENNSMFKNPSTAEKGIFDITKPVFEDKIVPHHKTTNKDEPKPIEFKKIESKNNGDLAEKPSPFKNTISIWERPKNEVSKPQEQVIIKPDVSDNFGSHTQSVESSVKPQIQTEDIFKPQTETVIKPKSQSEPVTKTETKTQTTPQLEVQKIQKLETSLDSVQAMQTAPKVQTVPKTGTKISTFPEVRPEVKTSPQPEIKTSQQPEVRTKVLTKSVTKPLTEVITASPKATPETKVGVALDVAYATTLIPKIMETTKVSQAEAVQIVTKALAKKYEGKAEVEVLTQPQTEVKTERKTQIQTENKTETQTESKIKPEVQAKIEKVVEAKVATSKVSKKHVIKKVKEKVMEKLKSERKVLFFARDKETNKNRVKYALSRAQFLFYKRQFEKSEVTGHDIADIMPKSDDRNILSELVETRSFDGSYEDFKKDMAKMGPVENLADIKAQTEKIALKNTAVKLTFKKPEEGATGKEATKIYRQPLNGVEAYVEEDSSVGHLWADTVVKEVEYINHTQTREYPVITELPENVEIELGK